MNTYSFPDIVSTQSSRNPMVRHMVRHMDTFFMLYVAAEIILSNGVSVKETLEYIEAENANFPTYLQRSGLYVLVDIDKQSTIEIGKIQSFLGYIGEKFPHVRKNIENNVIFY